MYLRHNTLRNKSLLSLIKIQRGTRIGYIDDMPHFYWYSFNKVTASISERISYFMLCVIIHLWPNFTDSFIWMQLHICIPNSVLI